MFQTIQILCTLFILITVYRSYTKEKKSVQCAMVCLCFLAAIGSNVVLQQIPMPKEEITIRALGEKNEEATADEILFKGFLLEGEEYNKIEILDGKWFWFGENYMWRNENDTRQPEGTTREITLAIPMGTHREAVFNMSQWNGKAEIQYGEHIQVVDFGPGNETNVELEDSDLIPLRLFKLLRLFLYLAIHLSLVFVCTYSNKNRIILKEKLTLYHHDLLLFSISILQFLIAFIHVGIDGFWYDELCQIYFSMGDGSLFGGLFVGSMPVPLSTFMQRIFYLILPYGEQWLLLPSMIVTSIGIFFIGKTATMLISKNAGLFATFTVALSNTVLVHCSYEARAYPYYFSSASLLLYFYIKRLQDMGNESVKKMLPLTFTMIFFSQMHYVGIVLCVALFFVDIFLFSHKKINKTFILSYMTSAVCYLPTIYVLLTLASSRGGIDNLQGLNNGWHATPTLSSLNNYILYLCGNSQLGVQLFFCGCLLALLLFFNKNHEFRKNDVSAICMFAIVFVTLFHLFLFFGLGLWLKNSSSSFSSFWTNRYFICLIPFITVIVSYGADMLIKLVSRKDSFTATKLIYYCLITHLVSGSLLPFLNSANSVRQPFRQAADYLYEQPNYIYNDTTLVISNYENAVKIGWEEYYLTQQGRRDEINLTGRVDLGKDPSILDSYSRVYVDYCHSAVNTTIENLLKESFELVNDNKTVKVKTYQRLNN